MNCMAVVGSHLNVHDVNSNGRYTCMRMQLLHWNTICLQEPQCAYCGLHEQQYRGMQKYSNVPVLTVTHL
jgi:hypothetical protein